LLNAEGIEVPLGDFVEARGLSVRVLLDSERKGEVGTAQVLPVFSEGIVAVDTFERRGLIGERG